MEEAQSRTRHALYGLSRAAGFDISVISVDDDRIYPFYGTDFARDASHPGRKGNQWLKKNWRRLAVDLSELL